MAPGNRARALGFVGVAAALVSAGGCASILGATDVPPAPSSEIDSGVLNIVDSGVDGSASGDEDASDATANRADGTDDTPPPGSEGGPGDASESGADAGPPCTATVLFPAGATSSPNAKQSATNAIDGDLTTRWESAWQIDPQWIFVDFGAQVHISEVRVLWEEACAVDYQIQVSNDAITWTPIATVTGNTQYNDDPTDYTSAVNSTGLSAVATYVRVYGTIRHDTSYGYSLWEIQVLGDTRPACNPD